MTSILNNFEIPRNIKINIKSFYVLYENLIIITKDDKVYGLGDNALYLGLGHNDAEECTEIKELSKQKIKEIFIGGGFVLALTKDNQIFGWGRNYEGQLGRGYVSEKAEILKPQKITFPSKKIIDISCGSYHTLVLLENGLIYGWGGRGWGKIERNLSLLLNNREFVNDPSNH